MLNNIKIAFFDLDGTLTNKDKKLTHETINSLRKLKDKGIIIVYCSGRWDTYMLDYDINLNLVDYIICNNGACIYDIKQNKVLLSNEMPIETIKEIKQYCSNLNLGLIFNGLLTRFTDDITDTSINDIPIYQSVITCNNKDLVNRIIEDMKDHPNLYISYISSAFYKNELTNNYTLNFNLKETNKGNAIKNILEILNIDKKDSICFGDNNNDISMFENCGINVAMENATKELKIKADYITLDHDSNGVAHFINKFIR